MGERAPYFVGIVGGSCAGKTWLAEKLQSWLGKEAAHLSLDSFYLDRAHLSEAQARLVNFDHPRSIDWERFEQVLYAFSAGKEARVPRYDYATHSRLPEEVALRPAPVMILDGLWLFRRMSVRRAFDLRIYLKSPMELCERRRLERDVRERGRTAEQTLEQFRATVAPSHSRYVAPQERWANMIFENPPDEKAVESIVRRVQTEIGKRSATL
jgi:uridine kinase